MHGEPLSFLEELLLAPGPSGYERPIQEVVRKFGGEFAEVSTDWHGNVTCAINAGESPRILLAGHCDQIGLIVKHIDDKGFLRIAPIGGWDVQMLIGQAMDVWTANGPVHGVIARKAIHLLTTEERNRVPQLKELFIDIGVKNREEAMSLVQVGDPVTLRLGMRKLRNNLISGPGMDNRVGVWVVMNAVKRAAEKPLSASIFSVSTVQEEIGLRGATTSAYTIKPHVGIAVDVTHATDGPDVDVNEFGKVDIGGGPVIFRGPNVNPVVFAKLTSLATANGIPFQVNALNRPASNDGNAIQLSRTGPATGIIGLPLRYMHSPVEVVSLDDLDHAAELLALFCASIDRDSDFTP